MRLHTLNAGGLSLIPGQGTISHVLQLILRVPQLKILHAEVKMIVHMPQLRPSAAKKKKRALVRYFAKYACIWVSLMFSFFFSNVFLSKLQETVEDMELEVL